MNPKRSPTRGKVTAALTKLGDSTVHEIKDETGLSIAAISKALERGAPKGYFKRVGEKPMPGRQPSTVWRATEPKPTRVGVLTPVVGAQQIRDHQKVLRDNHAVAEWDADDVGQYEVRRTNAHGYTVITPCSSRSYAELEQKMSGGEIVAIGG